MKENVSLTIFVKGEPLHFEVSKSTSCDDVIKMATKKMQVKQNKKCFGIFESLFGEQRKLPGQTKLLKHVRSWGSDRQNFSLEMKEVNATKTKMTSLSRANAKLQRLRNIIGKHELQVKSGQKFETDLHDNLHTNVEDNKQELHDKNITILGEVLESRRQESYGKKQLLNKYLNDSLDLSFSNDGFYDEDFLFVRTRGVGCEDDSFSEFNLHERTNGDGEEIADGGHVLNEGFIVSESLVNDKTFVVRDELNECVIYDCDGTIVVDDASFEEDSDYESIDELERNIIENESEATCNKLNDIKRILSNGNISAIVTEDEILDSFMFTFVNDDDSDEGMSSVASELE